MHIHYVINGLNGGGAAFPIPDLVSVMEECGHTVRVIALMPQDMQAADRLRHANIDYDVIGTGFSDMVGSYRKLLALLKEDKPDFIWTSLTRATIFGQLAGKQLNIPVVSWQHNAFLKPVNKFILRRLKGISRFWISDSDNVADYTHKVLGVPENKIHVWPIFMCKREARYYTPARKEGIPFRVGSLGRLHANKQYDVLLRVAHRISEKYLELAGQIEFVVAGEGPEREALQALQAELKVDNVNFIGFTDDVDSFLKGVDAYIQPSRNEGMCIAAHEAMEYALPVIATPVGELSHTIISGETGFLCEIGDVEQMTDAVAALALNPDDCDQMGNASRDRVCEKFAEDIVREKGKAILATIEKDLAL